MTVKPPDTTRNPLLCAASPPNFSAIRPEHIEPAVTHVLGLQRSVLKQLQEVDAPDVEWLKRLEGVYEAVHDIWNPVAHLNAVLSTPDLRDAYNTCLPLITEFYTDIGQNRELYRCFLQLREALVDADRSVSQVVKLGVRDFELAGVGLEGADRTRYKELMQGLAALQATFEQNLMDATDAFSYHETDPSALQGIPDIAMERAAAAAREKHVDGWLFALDPPTYQAVMSHAENAAVRRRFYEAWNTRASDQGPNAGRWDNGPLICEILALRQEAANLLGFANFAEESLATKMARSPSDVFEFLRDLAARSRKLAQREFAQLTALAGHDVEPWDVALYSERLKRDKLNLSEEALRPYFPLDRVLDGLFALAERLFEVKVHRDPSIDTWHPSVRYFRIEQSDGTEIGGLYTDLFARANKRGGAWMDACVNRSGVGATERLPIAHLVCNFGAPVGDTPSLLTHSDVVTLFHEFGHSLHHLLTEVEYPSVAGINAVAWDAVELPSQFFENFAFQPEVLADVAAHYKTGETLPAETVARLQRSRTFLAGLAMVRQLEFALFDFELHSRSHPLSLDQVLRILDDVRTEVAVIRPPSFARFAHGFAHIFGGGYAAGYYSYKWAEVLAADAFAAFEEAGTFDREVARKFRKAILAVGGSRDALDAFIDFRGREPQLEPLLKQAGMLDPPVAAG